MLGTGIPTRAPTARKALNNRAEKKSAKTGLSPLFFTVYLNFARTNFGIIVGCSSLHVGPSFLKT